MFFYNKDFLSDDFDDDDFERELFHNGYNNNSLEGDVNKGISIHINNVVSLD